MGPQQLEWHVRVLPLRDREHVVGLQYGLIAVNRRPQTVTLNGFQPIKPGQALILERAEPLLSDSRIQAG